MHRRPSAASAPSAIRAWMAARPLLAFAQCHGVGMEFDFNEVGIRLRIEQQPIRHHRVAGDPGGLRPTLGEEHTQQQWQRLIRNGFLNAGSPSR